MEGFLGQAICANTEFHIERKDLFEKYMSAVSLFEPKKEFIEATAQQHAIIQSALAVKGNGRDSDMTDAAKLAFLNAVLRLNKQVVGKFGKRVESHGGFRYESGKEDEESEDEEEADVLAKKQTPVLPPVAPRAPPVLRKSDVNPPPEPKGTGAKMVDIFGETQVAQSGSTVSEKIPESLLTLTKIRLTALLSQPMVSVSETLEDQLLKLIHFGWECEGKRPGCECSGELMKCNLCIHDFKLKLSAEELEISRQNLRELLSEVRRTEAMQILFESFKLVDSEDEIPQGYEKLTPTDKKMLDKTFPKMLEMMETRLKAQSQSCDDDEHDVPDLVEPENLTPPPSYDTLLPQYDYATGLWQVGAFWYAPLGTIHCERSKAQSSEPKTTVNLEEKQQVTNPQASVVTPTVTIGDNTGTETPGLLLLPEVESKLDEGTDPYPDQGLKTVLERQYLVDSFLWDGSAAIGDKLRTLSFPQLLWAVPNIKEKLDRFQFFRAGVEVTIRVNATSYHFGAMLVASIPHYKETATPPSNVNYFANIYTASNCDCSIFSVNTGVSTSVLLPYIAPARYWNLKDDPSTPAANGFFGQVVLFNLCPIRLGGSGTTPAVRVSIFAKFVNPQPAGLCLRDVAGASRLRKQNEELLRMLEEQRSEAQSGRHREPRGSSGHRSSHSGRYRDDMEDDYEQDYKTEAKTVGTNLVKSTKKSVSRAVADISSLGIDGLFSFLDPLAGSLADKPTDKQATTKVVNVQQTGLALADGLDGSSWLAMSPENFISNDASVYGQKRDYQLFENYKLLPSLLEQGSWAGSDPVNYRPFTIPVTPTYGTQYIDGTSTFFPMSHIANLSSFFRNWTGSLKYTVMFFTSKFISGRVQIKWLPDPTYSAAMTNDGFGDTVTHLIDITGDTSYSFTIPYLQETSWQMVPNPIRARTVDAESWKFSNGQIAMYVVNPLVAGSSDDVPVCYFAVFVSGGPDFRVACPAPLWDDFEDGTEFGVSSGRTGTGKRHSFMSERSKAQSASPSAPSSANQEGIDLSQNVRALFEKQFPSLIESKILVQKDVTMGESVTSWNQLMKRYAWMEAGTFTPGQDHFDLEPLAVEINMMSIFSRIRRTFHYVRGSWRLKWHVFSTTTAYSSCAMYAFNDLFNAAYNGDNPNFGASGIEYCRSDLKPWLEVQSPYYNYVDMNCSAVFAREQYNKSATRLDATPTQGAAAVPMSFQIWVAAGDDLSLGWPCQPVSLVLTTLSKQKEDTKKPALSGKNKN